jgi:hypothetical protein
MNTITQDEMIGLREQFAQIEYTADLSQVKIGRNVKRARYIVPDNPVLLRALGRALAQPRVGVMTTNHVAGENVTRVALFTDADGTERRIFCYSTVANAGEAYMRIFKENEVVASNYHVVRPEWADGKSHRVWMCAKMQDKKLVMSRVSYHTHIGSFAQDQRDAGIVPGSTNYVNPIALTPKYGFMVMLGLGETVGVKLTGAMKRSEVIDLLNTFGRDETADLLGIPFGARN